MHEGIELHSQDHISHHYAYQKCRKKTFERICKARGRSFKSKGVTGGQNLFENPFRFLNHNGLRLTGAQVAENGNRSLSVHAADRLGRLSL